MIRTNSFARPQTIGDGLVVLLAFSASLLVRSRFQLFAVTWQEIAITTPMLLGLRVGLLYVFGHYSSGGSMWLAQDVVDLLWHNMFASSVLLLLRFLSPFAELRLPLSVISLEYVFSTFLMISVRAWNSVRLQAHSSTTGAHRRHVIVWGEPRVIERRALLPHLSAKYNVRVVGIVTANRFFWGTEMDSVRVVGDEQRFDEILQVDESVSELWVVEPGIIPRSKLKRIFATCRKCNLDVASVSSQNVVDRLSVDQAIRPLVYESQSDK